MVRRYQGILILLGLFLTIGLVSGCGFHLRTYNFSGAVDSYAIIGKRNLDVAQQVGRELKQAGLQELPAAQAALVLEVIDQRRERRSISTAGSARAAEYETTYALQYRILNGQGDELAPSTWVERRRVYRIDRDNIVGSSEEQALLERELRQDLVGQIIRAMDTVSRESAPGYQANDAS